MKPSEYLKKLVEEVSEDEADYEDSIDTLNYIRYKKIDKRFVERK